MTAHEDQLALCLAIATRAHEGQVDKAGEPYIDHPVRVSGRCATEVQKAAALLHDVIEDTPLTADDLRIEGVADEVVRIVLMLTHDKGTDYMDYVRTVSLDPDARAVKMADLEDNMDLSRLPNPTEKDLERTEKYRRAHAILETACGRS